VPWLATARSAPTSPTRLRTIVDDAREQRIDASIPAYADIVSDCRNTRLMLRCWLGFNRACWCPDT